MIQYTLETLRKHLLHMAPDQLVQYLQIQTPGGPPPYLVLSALKEQDEMRNSAPQQSPQNTVAQQEMARAAPQAPAAPRMPPQGLGALPMESAPQTPEMPPQMQAGGHVHDYGVATLPYTPNYEEGGIVSFQEGGGITAEIKQAEEDGNFEEAARLRARQAVEGPVDQTPTPGYRPPYYNSMVPSQRVALEASLGRPPITPTPPPITSEELRGPEVFDSIAPPISKFPDIPDGATLGNIVPPPDYNANKREEDRRNMLRQFGVDPDFYEKQKAESKEDRAKLEKDKKKDSWNALAQAFLEVAGTPGSFGQALVAGARKGLGALKDVNKEFKDDERILKQEQKKLDMAEYAAKRGDAVAEMEYRGEAEEATRNFTNNKIQLLLDQKMAEFKIREARAMRSDEQAHARWLAEVEVRASLYTSARTLDGQIRADDAKLVRAIISANSAGNPTGETAFKIYTELVATLHDNTELEKYTNENISTLSFEKREKLIKDIAKAQTNNAVVNAVAIWDQIKTKLPPPPGYKVFGEE